MNISIIGSGTWGSALAETLAKHHHVILFSFFKDEIDNIASTRIVKNLPYMRLNDSIVCTSDISLACSSEILIFAVPSIYIHNTALAVKPYIKDDQIIVDVAKGIEKDSLYTMSEVIKSVLPNNKVVALSGPTHAEEVARNLPTTIVAAHENIDTAKIVADLFVDTCIKAYTNPDIIGVELCGALKNVIALFCGIVKGLGYGDNIKAAIITRGMNEIVRIGRKIGCFEQTFYGLAGIGDLIVTATSEHSRNNRCGQLIGQGYKVEDAVKEVGMVVEGLNALKPAIDLAKRYDVKMSIIEALYEIVYENKSAKIVVDSLMKKATKSELDKSELDLIFENKLIGSKRGQGMKRVITYGTFDLLHYGHINLLKRARALGDYLVVCLSTDEFNLNQKHKKTYFTYEQRKMLLESLRYVDLVIPEENWEQKVKDVKEYQIDVFVMGDDWKGKFDYLKDEGVEVIYLPRTPEISTTKIKSDLNDK